MKSSIDYLLIAQTDALYKLPLRYNESGEPFNVSANVARSLVPSGASFITPTSDKMADFAIVTAASSNYFLESMDVIASIQSVMPKKRILYFDLGLKDEEVVKVW